MKRKKREKDKIGEKEKKRKKERKTKKERKRALMPEFRNFWQRAL